MAISREGQTVYSRIAPFFRDGLLRAPLPAGIGSCRYVDEMSDAEIEAAFARLQAFMDANPEVRHLAC